MNEIIQKYEPDALSIGSETGLVQHAETISSVLAAQAEAEVKARYIVAMNRPRNIQRVRQVLKQECERHGFAEIAFYRLPTRSRNITAKPIQGLSIRFAEAAARAMGNVDMKAIVTYDDDNMRIIKATVIDIEANTSISTDIPIKKTIERRYLKEGEIAISHRLNSDGKTVYLRHATEDEIIPKQNSAISKAFRNALLRILPGDIQDECVTRILEIKNGSVPNDPKEQEKKIVDSFAMLGVNVEELEGFLGHKVETCSPSERQDLRDLFGCIKSGETTWNAETSKRESEPEESKTNADRIKSSLKVKKEEEAK